MLRAYNEENDDVYIDESKREEKYHCPICDKPVFRKMGNGLRRPHFAHNNFDGNGVACDGWHYDMSDWHREWQERFPVKCREIVVSYDGKKHRADVLIEEHKLVVEFQHSRLSAEEYAERNQFYSNAGYHIVWLFDMSEDYSKGRIVIRDDGNGFVWKRPWNTFRTTYEEGILQKKWCDNVHAVYFENDKTVSRLIGYDSDDRLLRISCVPAERDCFIWSVYTFELFLKDIFSEYYINVPECPRCHLPMMIRRYSMTRDLFWGCQNYHSTTSCTERKYFGGMLPVGVSHGGSCPYCGRESLVTNDGVICHSCGYVINYRQ